jgi:hypothetical protein
MLARIFHKTVWRDRETGNPLVADAACGAGLSGLSRRSFCEDGSAASANKMALPLIAKVGYEIRAMVPVLKGKRVAAYVKMDMVRSSI